MSAENPDRETLIAREALEKGMSDFLQSRGVKLDEILEENQYVAVHLRYSDWEEKTIRTDVRRFVKNQFHNRSLGIEEIVVSYYLRPEYIDAEIVSKTPDGLINIQVAHYYPRTPEEISQKKERIIVGMEETTGFPITEGVGVIEQSEDYRYFLIPEADVVLPAHLSLFPFETPMECRMAVFPLQDWLESRKPSSPMSQLKARRDLINRIIDPHGIGSAESRPRRTLQLPRIVRGSLEPNLVQAIASMIPDLSKEQALSTVSDPILGIRNFMTPQPKKHIVIS